MTDSVIDGAYGIHAGPPQIWHLRSSAGLYGAEYVVLGLVPEQRRLGYEAKLLTLQNPLQEVQLLYKRAQQMQVPCELLPCRGRFDWRTVTALRRALDATPHVLLHVHDYKSAFYAWLARGRRPVTIVATSHGQFDDTGALKLYHRIELMLARRFDHVCMVSEAMRATIESAGVAPQHISLVPNGIDTQRFRPQPEQRAAHRAAFGVPEGAHAYGAAMRLAPQKFPLGLIDAYAQARRPDRPSVLMIAGDGPLRSAMQERAAARGVAADLKLLGALDDLAPFYAAIDTFVLPSLYEGLPLALLEAMACSRPIIATAVGQVPEVLNGLPAQMLPPGDVAALGAAMRGALDVPLRSAGLRERVEEQYSLARMAQDYVRIYRAVAAR